ncbi:hypothetical protein GHK33_05435 [Sinorhizobium meliloti]|uniref:Uncharacterized protein n=1 Tax=Rhizobium meliloti TaxID=382 RepID=A0A6A7ZP40_RHIML|nr:hypothetical protein [Sinorhizobium meliloti]MDW9491040.1 hypothetical protein [Sinorhizobium meliloti]MDW9559564.1 hypothetical protein [Sinorhizobium meliloti]MDW9646839.1 hypothetical protein [Sinorhizobium meliloti]MDW9809693.1 hypothetical protein [Sinorhizobium meliloti]
MRFGLPGGLFDYLIPVLVTGIQPDQVLGLKERFPRRRRGAALMTRTEMRQEERLQSSDTGAVFRPHPL